MLNIEKEYVSLPKLLKEVGSVLIKAGENDDAFIYHAPIGQYIKPSTLMVFFHRGSQILERVKLIGALKVSVEFQEKAKFMGELSLFDHEEINGNVALLLNVHEEVEYIQPVKQCVMPIT